MKKLLCFCAVLAMTFSAVTAHAADVSGSWTGQMKNANGDGFNLTFTFKQDGTTLTGTVQGPQGGDPMPIGDGKVDGNNISFNVSVNGNTISHVGTINGDQITLTMKSDQGDFPGGDLVLTRTQ